MTGRFAKISDPAAATLVQRTVMAGLLAGTAISWPLWTLARELRPIPWIKGLAHPAYPWDRLLPAAWGLGMIWSFVRPGAVTPLALVAGFGGVWCLLDIARAQPWVYLYLLLLASACAHRWTVRRGVDPDRSARIMLGVCVLVVAAVYIYSGISKVSATYVPLAFAEILKPAIGWFGLSERTVRTFGHASVVLEILIGLAILLPRGRLAAATAATLMHIGILVCLGPLGRNENAVVWPWNVAMIGLVWIVALRRPDLRVPAAGAAGVPAAARAVHGLVLAAACLMPALGVAGLWPAYLSWSMYAGREPQVVIAMTATAAEHAPADLRRAERLLNSPTVRHSVVLSDWISRQTHARPFPELWYEEAVTRDVLARFHSIEEVRVIRLTRPGRFDGRDTLTNLSAAEFLVGTPGK